MKSISIVSSLLICSLPFTAAAAETPSAPSHPTEVEAGHDEDGCPAKPRTEPIPEKYAGENAVAIKFEDLKPVGERVVMEAILRIINPTDMPITFTSYSIPGHYSGECPITEIEHWKDGKWVKAEGWLKPGTRLHPCILAPGQSALFAAGVYPQTMPTRVGVAYTLGDREAELVVWSDKIER